MVQLVDYCENVTECRHKLIAQYFEDEVDPTCDFACDVCKDQRAVYLAREKGLVSEAWASTQSYDREDLSME